MNILESDCRVVIEEGSLFAMVPVQLISTPAHGPSNQDGWQRTRRAELAVLLNTDRSAVLTAFSTVSMVSRELLQDTTRVPEVGRRN